MILMFENPHTGENETFLYQWDKNVKMFVDLKNVETAEAVFGMARLTEGIRRKLTYTDKGWTCVVPDTVLQYGEPLYVSITYVDSGRKTVHNPFVVNVVKQIKPEGWVDDTQPEYITLDEAFQKAMAVIENADSILAAIHEAGLDVIGSIPEDYTQILTEVYSLKEIVDALNAGGLELKDSVIAAEVVKWLNNHPEKTTTVTDKSIGYSKLIPEFHIGTKQILRGANYRDLAENGTYANGRMQPYYAGLTNNISTKFGVKTPDPDVTMEYVFQHSSIASGQYAYVIQRDIPCIQNETYTLSFYAKSTAAGGSYVSAGVLNSSKKQTFSVNTEWERCTYTFVVDDSWNEVNKFDIFVGFDTAQKSALGSFEVCGVLLNAGGIPVDISKEGLPIKWDDAADMYLLEPKFYKPGTANASSWGIACDEHFLYQTEKADPDNRYNIDTTLIKYYKDPNYNFEIADIAQLGSGYFDGLNVYNNTLYTSGCGDPTTNPNNIKNGAYDCLTKVDLTTYDRTDVAIAKSYGYIGIDVIKFSQITAPVIVLHREERNLFEYYTAFINGAPDFYVPLCSVDFDPKNLDLKSAFECHYNYIAILRSKQNRGNMITFHGYNGKEITRCYLDGISLDNEATDFCIDEEHGWLYVTCKNGAIYVYDMPDISTNMVTSLAAAGVMNGILKHVYVNKPVKDDRKNFKRANKEVYVDVYHRCCLSELVYVGEFGSLVDSYFYFNDFKYPIHHNSDFSHINTYGTYYFSDGSPIQFALTFERTMDAYNYFYDLKSASFTYTTHSTGETRTLLGNVDKGGIDVVETVKYDNQPQALGTVFQALVDGGWIFKDVYVNNLDMICGLRRSHTSLPNIL